MKFREEKSEKLFTVLLRQEGFPHSTAITIARRQNPKNVSGYFVTTAP